MNPSSLKPQSPNKNNNNLSKPPQDSIYPPNSSASHETAYQPPSADTKYKYRYSGDLELRLPFEHSPLEKPSSSFKNPERWFEDVKTTAETRMKSGGPQRKQSQQQRKASRLGALVGFSGARNENYHQENGGQEVPYQMPQRALTANDQDGKPRKSRGLSLFFNNEDENGRRRSSFFGAWGSRNKQQQQQQQQNPDDQDSTSPQRLHSGHNLGLPSPIAKRPMGPRILSNENGGGTIPRSGVAGFGTLGGSNNNTFGTLNSKHSLPSTPPPPPLLRQKRLWIVLWTTLHILISTSIMAHFATILNTILSSVSNTSNTNNPTTDIVRNKVAAAEFSASRGLPSMDSVNFFMLTGVALLVLVGGWDGLCYIFYGKNMMYGFEAPFLIQWDPSVSKSKSKSGTKNNKVESNSTTTTHGTEEGVEKSSKGGFFFSNPFTSKAEKEESANDIEHQKQHHHNHNHHHYPPSPTSPTTTQPQQPPSVITPILDLSLHILLLCFLVSALTDFGIQSQTCLVKLPPLVPNPTQINQYWYSCAELWSLEIFGILGGVGLCGLVGMKGYEFWKNGVGRAVWKALRRD
jgi:hypothetical protein